VSSSVVGRGNNNYHCRFHCKISDNVTYIALTKLRGCLWL